jgi:hypothetical protein
MIGGCCHGAPAAPAKSPNTKPQMQENSMDNGAHSPTGEAHPGRIVHDDKVDGRTWTVAAADVPKSIAWVDVNGTWKAVVRIEITGTPDQRRITKFGTDGQMLETTIQAPAPRPPATH